MLVHACQLDSVWEDKPANFAKVRALLPDGNIARGSLIVLPEMFATGFSMNAAGIAEPPGGATQQFLAELAGEYQSFVIGGLATRTVAGNFHNEALVLSPGRDEIGRYVKQQPFTLGGERDHYAAGKGHLLVQCGDAVVSPFVCYDLRFPELFRPAVREGAQVIVVIANWPRPRDAHWRALLVARAIENQAYVIGVNRSGNDPRLSYRGQSAIIDPHGQIVADAGETEGLIAAELDLQDLIDYRRKFPALADMPAIL